MKYIEADDDDEGGNFLNESSLQLKTKGKTTRGANSSSKHIESGFFHLKI